ncbi:DUF4339 domain-containing protein [Phragmitibacter flavus]|uniref:DUF4339 domain-containing protein n=1 Tax=Phragmitibacter flavus TaxID=2576071 RepID=A0A5R8KBN6_9BACT|nr:DUF4339 domain-containing protein [Phragmitibacter flavus]TLD69724.1 DUF4339 domain-containing protein [Phragmitibacter flavus]
MSETRWYHALNGKALGPVSETEMKALIKEGKVSAQSLIWKPEMDRWNEVEKVSPDWLKTEPEPVAVAAVVVASEKKAPDIRKTGKVVLESLVKGGKAGSGASVSKGGGMGAIPVGVKTEKLEEKKGLWGKIFKR